MRKDKPDTNKAEIVEDLRSRGYIWIDVGGAVDGIAIGYNHNLQQVAVCLVEIKNPARKVSYTDSEKRLIAALNDRGYHGVHITAQSVEPILRWFGAI